MWNPKVSLDWHSSGVIHVGSGDTCLTGLEIAKFVRLTGCGGASMCCLGLLRPGILST